VRSPPTSVSPRFVSIPRSTVLSDSIRTPHNHIFRHENPIDNRQSRICNHHYHHYHHTFTLQKHNTNHEFQPTVPLSEEKELTPSSRTVRIHEIHLRTRLDYGSVQWSNVSDEPKNGVFDVFVNGGIDIGPACPVSRGCESNQILAPRGGFGVVAWSV
jgi:hypothetical protein